MDKYTKVAKIGQGSFGCAYLVTRKSDPLAKKYVVKEIRMDPRDKDSALREAKLLAALDHPNIIACKESFLLAPPAPVTRASGARALPPQQQVLCIVTEFADGGDLRKRLERSDRLSESEILDLFVQVCLALKHLHDRKIIHRDIKPENIFLTRANVVKLGDFGVATVLSNTLACAETMTGTPYYTSPEICLGKRYNSKTDIWSLGCVLYELATRTHAFNGRSQRQLFDNIVNASVAPIPAAAASKRLADLVVEMLRKNPRERPSVNQLIKKPIVMERIQGFLSERALADELNHTVLHGHHIFRKHQPSPATAAAAATPPPPPVSSRAPAVLKPGAKSPSTDAAANAARRADAALMDKRKQLAAAVAAPKKKLGAGGKALLKRTRSFKKNNGVGAAAAGLSSSPARALAGRSPAGEKKRVSSGASAPSSSPSKSTLEQRNRLLLQKKRAVVEKAKQDALRARLVPPAPEAAAAPKAQADAKSAPVADRVSAFNAQWRAQRQQLMQNLPMPPPPPLSAAAPNAPGVLPPPPPPAPVSGAAKPAAPRPSEYPRPIETPAPSEQVFVPPTAVARPRTGAAVVKAAAAKQRDAMRKDIQSRKLQLKRAAGGAVRPSAAGAAASPLDDPIILVQNLPDYRALSPPPSSVNSTGNSDVPAPPPSVPVASENRSEDEGQDDTDGDASGDGETDDCGVEAAPVNLEFERMVLQLKSVVESPDLIDDDGDDSDDSDDSDGEDDSSDRRLPREIPEERSADDDDDERFSTTAACSPLPPAYDDNALALKPVPLTVLSVATLEDPTFTQTLRALLQSSSDAHEELMERHVPREHHATLRYMHKYIASVARGHHEVLGAPTDS